MTFELAFQTEPFYTTLQRIAPALNYETDDDL